jgi:hypothetical protein
MAMRARMTVRARTMVRVRIAMRGKMVRRARKILLKIPLYSQRCNLTEDEQAYLQEILSPTNIIIGIPIVTHLTRTNNNSLEMVSSLNM